MKQLAPLHPDRLFPAAPAQREICQHLYDQVKQLPIISPHGHTDPAWFAEDKAFSNPTELLILPDHYVLRMLYSRGVTLESLGQKTRDGRPFETDPRKIWSIFADHYYLFAGTPSRMWLDHVIHEVFGIEQALTPATATTIYDTIDHALQQPAFRPRALLDRFNIDLIATTEGALDPLTHHRTLVGTGYEQRVISTFRPDDVTDPDQATFTQNVAMLAELTGYDTSHWHGYLDALRSRREFFRVVGRATATDHGHPTAITADLGPTECQALLDLCLQGKATAHQKELFRGQMLTEMAGMSIEDKLVMQIHPGSYRNHNRPVFDRFGPDKGGDIPVAITYTQALAPLLNKYGNDPQLNIILFTLDETNYARELAPLAGHYPCLRLGPAWWFHDSPQGMLRYRDQVTETAGFYNTAGFNDDTRAFLSIPARHDVARRMDCHYLSTLVAEHKIALPEAERLIVDLSYNLARESYQLPLPPVSAEANVEAQQPAVGGA